MPPAVLKSSVFNCVRRNLNSDRSEVNTESRSDRISVCPRRSTNACVVLLHSVGTENDLRYPERLAICRRMRMTNATDWMIDSGSGPPSLCGRVNSFIRRSQCVALKPQDLWRAWAGTVRGNKCICNAASGKSVPATPVLLGNPRFANDPRCPHRISRLHVRLCYWVVSGRRRLRRDISRTTGSMETARFCNVKLSGTFWMANPYSTPLSPIPR